MFSETAYTDDEEPYAKKLKLSIDLERIIMGEMLTDLEINYVQKLLKSQFPGINGLCLTLLQSKIGETKEPANNKLQIVLCRETGREIIGLLLQQLGVRKGL